MSVSLDMIVQSTGNSCSKSQLVQTENAIVKVSYFYRFLIIGIRMAFDGWNDGELGIAIPSTLG